MSYSWITAVVFLIVMVNICRADPEKIRGLICSDDPDTQMKLGVCLEQMPAKIVSIKEVCQKAAAPDIATEGDFRKAACDDSTGVGAKMGECMMDKRDVMSSLPAEDMKKIVDTMECLTGMLA